MKPSRAPTCLLTSTFRPPNWYSRKIFTTNCYSCFANTLLRKDPLLFNNAGASKSKGFHTGNIIIFHRMDQSNYYIISLKSMWKQLKICMSFVLSIGCSWCKQTTGSVQFCINWKGCSTDISDGRWTCYEGNRWGSALIHLELCDNVASAND